MNAAQKGRKMNTGSIHQLSASELYALRQATIQARIAALHDALAQHAARQVNEPADYGYPSDLGWVGEQLEHIIAGLGGV